MAMLFLAHDWAQASAGSLAVATVDHGLRPEARAEAAMVAQTCEGLGIPHDVLTWADAPDGNLQDAARRARYHLLSGWAGAQGVDAVALAHTGDDQAETFIMRLARGSGVDGLAPMRDDWRHQGARWLRPLLAASRSDLRGDLRARGQSWVDDPSNDDPRFDRVRVRQAMSDLAALGLDRDRLIDTARHMGAAREVLQKAAYDAAKTCVRVEAGDVIFACAPYEALPVETRHRLLAAALRYVASNPYRPRYDALCAAEAQALAGKKRTLAGCVLTRQKDSLCIGRELSALRDVVGTAGGVWDGRWRLQVAPGQVIRALGPDINACDTWRDTGVSRDCLMTTPAIFDENTLIAAPEAGFGDKNVLKTAPSAAEFLKSILSH